MNHTIKFKFSELRKIKTKNNFNSKLRPYWQSQLEDMFRRWR